MIKIVVGNMFDYPAEYLFIGSNVRGHCEKPTSNVMQVLDLFTEEDREEYELVNQTLQKYGTGNFYVCKKGSPFGTVFIGYPGTGHQESFEKMLTFGLISVKVMRMMAPGMVSITMPLIGTNVGGLDLEEWVESFNKVLKEYDEGNPAFKFIESITIVCKTDEQAKFLLEKIVLTYPPAI